MKKGISLLCFSVALLISLPACSGKATSPAASSVPPAVSSAPQAALDRVASVLSQEPERLAQVQEMQKAAQEALGDEQLAVDEQICISYKNGAYLLVGSGFSPITELKELSAAFPTWLVPASIGAYTFDSAVVSVSDNPTFRESAVVPQGKKVGEAYKIELKSENLQTADFSYKGETETIQIFAAFPGEERFEMQMRAAEASAKIIDEVYTLYDGSAAGSKILSWQNNGITYYAHGAEDSLAGLAQTDIKALIACA